MTEIFFTADTHFNHSAIIAHCNRPFSDVEQMNETIIANWNSLIKKGDVIYFLGDFGFGNVENLREIKNRLKGKIILIRGNHDNNKICRLFGNVKNNLEIKIGYIKFLLCHYCMYTEFTWPYLYEEVYHLYGHAHGRLPEGLYRKCDVGVDCWDFKPVNINLILEKFKNYKEITKEKYSNNDKHLKINLENNKKLLYK